MLAALLITGVALRFIVRRAGLGSTSLAEDAPALFIWLSPKLQFILEQSWVDPVQIMWITLLVAAHVAARPTLAATLLGVAASSKQTMFWLVPLAAVLLGWDRRQWLITGAVALALPLPFILWDFRALKHANFDFLNALPARPDALTFINWYARKYATEIPGNIAFLLAALVAGVSIWKLSGSTAKFGVALLSTYVTFFVFNRWAFANYYFTLCGLSALAAACSWHAPELANSRLAASTAGGAGDRSAAACSARC
jgi:predicted membrane-bound dolichyl-phosphate-mannose-protein mannosyltransferase